MKKLSLLCSILLIGASGMSVSFAKGHDAGRVDITGGFVASHDVAGVGHDADGNFLGVADSLNSDINYGRNVVQDQVANDTRRVIPLVKGRNVR